MEEQQLAFKIQTDSDEKKHSVRYIGPLTEEERLKRVIRYWQKKWNNSETGCHLKNIQPSVSLGNSSKCLKTRSAQVALHQVKIGRSKLI